MFTGEICEAGSWRPPACVQSGLEPEAGVGTGEMEAVGPGWLLPTWDSVSPSACRLRGHLMRPEGKEGEAGPTPHPPALQSSREPSQLKWRIVPH